MVKRWRAMSSPRRSAAIKRSLRLGELDPAFIDNEILPADTTNGKTLFGALGRFRLVLPKDKHGAHSARMLTKIEVVQIRK